MTVFKAYMKIAWKNVWLIFMYMGIFFTLTLIFQGTAETENTGYQAEGTTVGVVDEDGGALAESLIRMLGTNNEVLILPDDTEVLQENLFYRNVEYIVRIPENFMKRCIEDEENLKVTAVPDTYSGSYVDQSISSFINFARSYYAAGFSEEEIAACSGEQQDTEVVLMDFAGNEGKAQSYVYYYRYLPFLLLSVICYMMGYILIGFRRGRLPQRMRASSVPARRQTMEGLFASLVLSIGIWAVCMGAAFLLYGRNMIMSGSAAYYLLNSIALLAVSLTLAYLIAILVGDSNELSGIVNITALGMCFVCGTFVEMDLLSSGVRKAAQFLPVYWYETVNNLLAGAGDITGSIRTEIFQGIGIQFVFAAAFVCITLAASRER